jgi:tripartite-type tricarboxylate transporter receptor subunit TctC
MVMFSRSIAATTTALLAVVVTPLAVAQDYPARPIHLVVGGGAGSITDSVARPLADRLGAVLGQPVVVENRPGAGGIVGMEAVARAAPDGYTIGLATMSQVVFNPFLFAKLPYDPAKDLAPIANLVSGPMVVATHSSHPIGSMRDLINAARAQPGKIHYAVPALGSPPHVVSLLTWKAANVSLTVVPFRGGAEALANVLSGEVPVLFDAPPIIAAHVKTGRLKALAVTGEARDPSLPDTPTLTEAGVEGVKGDAWIGLVAPAGTSPAIIKKLNGEVAGVLASEEVARAYRGAGWRIRSGSPEAFGDQIRDDRALWGAVIRESGIRLD